MTRRRENETRVAVLFPWCRGDQTALRLAWSRLQASPSAFRFLGQHTATTRTSGLRDLRARAQTFRSMLVRAGAPATTWLGVGGPSDLASSDSSARHEAIRAVELARMLRGIPRAVLYVDMMLVDAIADRPDVQRRLAELLRPINGPPRPSPELVTTLQAYFLHDLSKTATAQALGVHRHTIDYRLGRVESLLGLSPDRPDERTLLQFAFAAQALRNSTVERDVTAFGRKDASS